MLRFDTGIIERCKAVLASNLVGSNSTSKIGLKSKPMRTKIISKRYLGEIILVLISFDFGPILEVEVEPTNINAKITLKRSMIPVLDLST